MPGTTVSSELCPRCQFAGIHTNFLKNQEGRFETFCDAGHKFQDTEGLRQETQAAKTAFPEHAPKPAEPAPAAPVQVITIGPEDKQELERVLETEFTGASDLKGAIFVLKQDLAQAQQDLVVAKKSTQQPANASPSGLKIGQVAITIPEWAQSAVNEQAEFNATDPTLWVQEQFELFLEQFLGAPARG